MGFLLNNCTFKVYDSELINSCEPFDCGNTDLNDFFRNDSLNYHSELLVAGTYVLNEGIASEDVMVNEINDVAPDVIISRLAYPKQEKLIFDNKKRINGEIWLALLEQMDKPSHRSEKLHKVKVYLYKKVFRRRVNKYQKTKD